jgi:hypothetical protein
MPTEPARKCIYCGDPLTRANVHPYSAARLKMVDKCDSCTDKLESGADMYAR